jgi:hypothetical protein
MADARSDEHEVTGVEVGAGDGVCVGDAVGDGLRDGDAAGDGVRDGDAEGETDGDTEGDTDGAAVAVTLGIVLAVPPEPLHWASPTLSAVSATNPSMEIFARDRRKARNRISLSCTLISIPPRRCRNVEAEPASKTKSRLCGFTAEPAGSSSPFQFGRSLG